MTDQGFWLIVCVAEGNRLDGGAPVSKTDRDMRESCVSSLS